MHCPLPRADLPVPSRGPTPEVVWPSSVKSAAKTQPVPKPAVKPSLQPSLFQTLLFLLPKSCPIPRITFLLFLHCFPPVFLPWLPDMEKFTFGPVPDPVALAGQL